MNSFIPDWTKWYTPKEAMQDLPEFIFRGFGWYFHKGDTLLVMPGENDKHFFCCYNSTDASLVFNQIVNFPVREDDR